MRTSNQGMDGYSFRPTVKFFYFVQGFRNDSRHKCVTRTVVHTNKRDALKHFEMIQLELDEYVEMYETSGKTLQSKPHFSTKLMKTRKGWKEFRGEQKSNQKSSNTRRHTYTSFSF